MRNQDDLSAPRVTLTVRSEERLGLNRVGKRTNASLPTAPYLVKADVEESSALEEYVMERQGCARSVFLFGTVASFLQAMSRMYSQSTRNITRKYVYDV